MTTEEKAKAYAEEAFAKALKAPWPEAKQAFADAYLAGAAEALSSQWKDASRELPKPEQDVFVAYSFWADIYFTTAFIMGFSDGHVEWHGNETSQKLDNVQFWLPIPPLPNTEEQ